MSDTSSRPRRVIVVVYARNRVIGRDNAMPWRMPSDLKHFKSVTLGRPMVMGRKTFLSIGRPLPGRTTIVVTRDAAFRADGVVVATSLKAGIAAAEEIARRDGVDEIMITGGGEIYAQALPLMDRVIATELSLDVEGVVYFPELLATQWRVTSRTAVEAGPGDDASYEIVIYDRLPASSSLT